MSTAACLQLPLHKTQTLGMGADTDGISKRLRRALDMRGVRQSELAADAAIQPTGPQELLRIYRQLTASDKAELLRIARSAAKRDRKQA